MINIRHKSSFLSVFFMFFIMLNSLADNKEPEELSGEVIAYDKCGDTEYPVANSFDNDMNTYFRSCYPFGNWIGLDLGEKCVITELAYAPRIDSDYRKRLQLGVFEGANSPDFGDAVTLFVVPDLTEREMTHQAISCTRAFRYVRFVFPTAQIEGKSSYMSELKFFGYADVGDDSQLPQITNLPTISIHTTESQDITSKDEYIHGIVSIVYDNGASFFSDSLKIRGRGNNSWSHPKKPYRMKLAHSTHLLGLPAKAKNWTLINNYGDKTLMRNVLAFDFSRRLQMPYTSPAEAVDLVVNGDYKGCYQLCDHIDVRENRVNIEEFDSTSVNTDYFIEIDAYAYGEAKNFTSRNYTVPVTVKYPDEDEITPAQENYIASHFEKLVASVNSNNYLDETRGFRNYLDEETFLRHFLVGEYSGNTDTYWSVKMIKRKNDNKFYFGPVWDFDLGFENDHRTYSITERTIQNNEWISLWNETSAAGGAKDMIRKIMSDDMMIESLRDIYSQYRDNGVVSKEILVNVVDSCANLLEESQDLNFKRWPILDSYVHENPVVYGTYDAEVENVRHYIANRIDWLDSKLEYIPSSLNSTLSQNQIDVTVYSINGKLYVENLPEHCTVRIIDVSGVIRFEKRNIQDLALDVNQGVYLISIVSDANIYTYKHLVY